MIINSLKLVNWRGYESCELTFDPKVNLVLGDNGSGKTNLVEAIYYLSLTRSWRSNDSSILIRQGNSNAYLKAKISVGELKKEIEICLSKNEKKVSINGTRVKVLTELSKCLNVIVFSPSDVALFMESPSVRRNFLDVSICKVDSFYQEALRSYNNLLNQRNALLKNERIDLDLLSVLTQQLALEAVKITKRRQIYVEQINQVLPSVVEKLLGKRVEASILYHPYIAIDQEMETNTIKVYQENQPNDLKVGHTTIGPHKEDYEFLFNGIDLASYGSQGQNRICVLATKLAPYFLVKEEEEKPIIVLDDVTSELDEVNSNNLLNLVNELGQVFISATNLNVKGASVIDVASNIASRRNQ